ncbi:hypothetical protein E1176_05200, partial [Fulvivirga sp. RKSG066]|uniref:OmpA family protein n=1 Tax=Fulvivirga aurantia TaxID=2529383 RepID=UPI0012BC72F8
AIDAYKRALSSDGISKDEVKLKIAESYRKLNQPENAVKWYEEVMRFNYDNIDAIYILHYAEALNSQKQYADAKEWYETYNTRAQNDGRAQKKLNTLNNQKQLYRNEATVSVRKTSFNSDAADFCPTVIDEGIVFVSSRESDSPLAEVFNWDKSNYLDLFIYKDGKVTGFDKTLNSKFHEGPAAFYDNGNKIIFTRNNYLKGKINESKEGVTKLKLYASAKDADGEWAVPMPLSFNSDEYSVGHPAISPDGNTLYFASDMPGGAGGVDIYKSQFQDGQWQTPVNLGDGVNTEGNELFPSIQNNKLYFASNGHGGLGGLDIFVTDLSKTVLTAENVGSPINGSLDDFGLVMNEDENGGFFSSNRDGSGNQDDIYIFNTDGPLVMVYQVSGKVYDKRADEPVTDVLVYLVNDQEVVINSVKTDSLGNYTLPVEPNQSYKLQAGTQDYLTTELPLVTTGSDDKTAWEVDLPLSKDYGFALKGLVTDNANQENLEGVKVTLIDNLSNEKALEANTLGDGVFNYKIKDYEIEDRISYQIKLEKEGYLTKMLVFNTQLDEPGTYDLNNSLNLGLDKLEIGADIGKLIDIQPIYFDVGKYAIRPDAANELNKVVEIMKENPGIEIELGSHTDSRGSASSNLRLSDKRAKASAQYIISQGIDESRIIGKGYGEQQLINKCSDGVPCSAEEHQLNRRTEFKITKF